MPSSYIPGYDQKRSYQPNMLKAIGCVAISFTLFGLFLLSLQSEPDVKRTSDKTALPNPELLGAPPVVHEEPKPAKTSLQGLNPYAREHQGFAGFNGYTIVRNEVVPIKEDKQVIHTHELTSAASDSITSYSELQGTDTGMFLPDTFAAFLPEDTIQQPVIMDRDVQVLHKVDPDYPPVAIERRKEGFIAVVLYVDSMGMLAPLPSSITGEQVEIKTLEFTVDGTDRSITYAMTENPPDFFFGSNFLKVLPKWEFLPKIENGVAVNSVFIIKYNFCLGLNCLRLEMITPSQH